MELTGGGGGRGGGGGGGGGRSRDGLDGATGADGVQSSSSGVRRDTRWGSLRIREQETADKTRIELMPVLVFEVSYT